MDHYQEGKNMPYLHTHCRRADGGTDCHLTRSFDTLDELADTLAEEWVQSYWTDGLAPGWTCTEAELAYRADDADELEDAVERIRHIVAGRQLSRLTTRGGVWSVQHA